MDRHTFLGTVVVLAAIIGIILYAAMRPVPAQAPGTTDSPVLSGSSYNEHAPYYDIVANYATSTPLRGSANAAAVAQMKKFVSDTIAQFKNDGNFANLTQKDITMMGFDKGRKETLQILYLISSSPHTVSYIFTVYADTLGAHGNTLFHTFTFNTTTGESLALADLFNPGADYLGTLSSRSRSFLAKNMAPYGDANEIAAGTTPTDANFKNFFIDNGTLDILFPPYQVGPYSAGPQTVQIPLSELSGILKPAYR